MEISITLKPKTLKEALTILSRLEDSGVPVETTAVNKDASEAEPTKKSAPVPTSPVVKPEPVETECADEPEVAEPAPKPEEPEIKKEDVRAVLAAAKSAGHNIADILKPFGATLGAVDPKDYAALINAANAVMNKEDAA